jgi:hypothetical protein
MRRVSTPYVVPVAGRCCRLCPQSELQGRCDARLGAPVVTSDRRIRDYPHVATL